ncbi:MAG: hypothetical protein JXA23_08425 [Bacteroidales bacterium]|nr:hypothetical protein [Bacteroidales bacterium]
MKKLVLLPALIFGIVFIAGQTLAQTTQSPEKSTKAQTTQTTQTTQNTPGNFVDKNGDGICDNHQARGNQANCANFVDANKDGVCDNYKGKGNCGQGNCCGKGMKKGNCPGMQKGNCCGKGMGNQHRNGQNNPQPATTPEPEKK